MLFIAAFALGGSGDVPNAAEVIGLILFPFGVSVGLIIAWWREWLGSLIGVASLAAFYVWMTMLDGQLPKGPYFILLAAPALLFLASWMLQWTRPEAGI